MGQRWKRKLLTLKVIWGIQSSWSAPIIVVPKGDGGKCLVIDYCTLNKVTRKLIWPMPKVEDIFSQLMVQNTFQHWTFEQDITIFLWTNPQSLRLHSPHHLKNMNISKYSHKHQHTSKNSWLEYWKILTSQLLIWTTSSFSVGEWKNTWITLNKFLKS